jgi:glycosyltransferase involved in cell wall biosynthesis
MEIKDIKLASRCGNTTMTKIDISLVVPCFNEEAVVPVFHEDAVKTCVALNRQFEIIFVDDGSKDGTLAVLQNLARQDSRIHFISFSRNFGKEAALLAGMRSAQGQYVVTLDVDGQDPPRLLPEMLNAVESGQYDCAGTKRVNRTGEPPVRSFFARRFYSIMKNFCGTEIVDGARDFRLMNRKYLEAVLSLQEQNRFSKGIFPWVGFRTKWFEYENIGRTKGKTKWSFRTLFLYSLDGITAFSSKPLAVASVLGILTFLVSLVFIGLIVVRRIAWGDPVDGWASTVCIILFCSGLQLFAVGILGQYSELI